MATRMRFNPGGDWGEFLFFAGVGVLIAIVLVRAHLRGSIRVGSLGGHYVRRDQQEVRYWVAFSSVALFLVLSLWLAAREWQLLKKEPIQPSETTRGE